MHTIEAHEGNISNSAVTTLSNFIILLRLLSQIHHLMSHSFPLSAAPIVLLIAFICWRKLIIMNVKPCKRVLVFIDNDSYSPR